MSTYLVKWCNHEGNQKERRFESLDDARTEASGLRNRYDGVEIVCPWMPDFLNKAIEDNRTVIVRTTDGCMIVGRIIDVDVDFRAITLASEHEANLIFMHSISTIT